MIGLTRQTARKVKRWLWDDRFKKDRPRLPAPVPYPLPLGHHFVKVTSTTATAGRYPGTWHLYDAANGTFAEQAGAVWVVLANGGTPSAATYYHAVAAAPADGRAVFVAYDVIASGSLGTGARVYKDGNQSVNDALLTTLSGFSETDVFSESGQAYDDGGYFSSSATSVLTAPQAGVYLIGGSVAWAASASGYRQIALTVNTSTDLAGDGMAAATAGGSYYQSLATVFKATAGDEFRLRVYQDSGGALNILGRNGTSFPRTVFWIHRIG